MARAWEEDTLYVDVLVCRKCAVDMKLLGKMECMNGGKRYTVRPKPVEVKGVISVGLDGQLADGDESAFAEMDGKKALPP